MIVNKVRVTLTHGVSAKRVFEETFDPAEKTPSIAAKDLIAEAIVLRDGDDLSVEFLSA